MTDPEGIFQPSDPLPAAIGQEIPKAVEAPMLHASHVAAIVEHEFTAWVQTSVHNSPLSRGEVYTILLRQLSVLKGNILRRL